MANSEHYKYQLEYFSMKRNISKVWYYISAEAVGIDIIIRELYNKSYFQTDTTYHTRRFS
jgi:hypothetical protein